MTDPLSPVWLHILHMVAITLTVPLSFPIDSFGLILFWWEKKTKTLASMQIQSSGSVAVGDFLAERVLHKYNAPVVMLSRLSHNPYSMSVLRTHNCTLELRVANRSEERSWHQNCRPDVPDILCRHVL